MIFTNFSPEWVEFNFVCFITKLASAFLSHGTNEIDFPPQETRKFPDTLLPKVSMRTRRNRQSQGCSSLIQSDNYRWIILGTSSNRTWSNRCSCQTTEIHSSSILFEWKSSCWQSRLCDRVLQPRTQGALRFSTLRLIDSPGYEVARPLA